MSLTLEHIYIRSLEALSLNSVWWMSLSAAAAVGLVGVIPIFFIDFIPQGNNQESKSRLRLMLSLSVGGLLGDVFLHLLPEAWAIVYQANSSIDTHTTLGLWVVSGISTFLTIEMIFLLSGSESVTRDPNTLEQDKQLAHSNDIRIWNGDGKLSNEVKAKDNDANLVKHQAIPVTGYLSVFANGVDNFTHGLAIAASFSAGTKIGILTTVAILIHEVPHEFGDFAILMRSGFSKWRAVQAQMLTATVAMFGAAIALLAEATATEVGSRTQWILPYSAGCFLYIAMSNILPDLMKENNPKESVKQIVCIVFGIAVMGMVNRIGEISMIPIA